MIIRISEVLLVAVRFNYVLLNGFLFIFFFTTMSLTNFVINFSFKFSAGGGGVLEGPPEVKCSPIKGPTKRSFSRKMNVLYDGQVGKSILEVLKRMRRL